MKRRIIPAHLDCMCVMTKTCLLKVVFACLLLFSIATSNAATMTFDWTDANTNVVRGNTSFSLTVGGITASVESYVAEWDGSEYDIFGAFPTNTAFTTVNADGFLQGPEGLLLEEGSFTGIALSGEEGCADEGGCGFDNGPYKADPDQNILKSNFAVVTFDQAVNLETSLNMAQSNVDHDFWLSTSLTAPNLGLDFLSALAGFTTTVHDPLASFHGATNLSGTHQNLRYLAIGAPLHASAGSFPGFDNPDDQLIDSVAVTSFTVQPTVVPIPAAVWLFGSGLLGLFGIYRRKNSA